jgi:2-aminoadipate transaminase
MSKVLSPGLRIGFCVAPKPLLEWMVLAKQGTDLHTSSYDQAIAAEYVRGGHLEKQLPKIIDVYRPRQLAILSALAKNMPAGFRWSKPEGGMFIWVEGPKGLDTGELYREAVENKVAYVPGEYFFTEPGMGKETMRLNYTNSDVETLGRAVRILAGVIKGGLERMGNSREMSRQVAG